MEERKIERKQTTKYIKAIKSEHQERQIENKGGEARERYRKGKGPQRPMKSPLSTF